MSDDALPKLDRITELLADRALFGLDEAEQRELDELLIGAENLDLESMDRAAATAQLAMLEQTESLPEHLHQRLVLQGQQAVGMSNPTAESVVELPNFSAALPRRELIAWLVAAASVAYAFVTVTDDSPSSPQSPAELRNELLALAKTDAATLTQVAWSAGPDTAGENATGDVVWHNDRQQGVMRFSGLAANDPSEMQYQLWIFDGKQDDRYPIDGGVFDMPTVKESADGKTEVFVKIDAKLPVVDPTMFAITIEKPGGVVVSSRKRLPLIAQVE